MFTFWKKTEKPKETAKPSREDILARAKANAAAARAEIGDETLQKIKEAMLKRQSSEFEQAKQKIKSMDQTRVQDTLKEWMREKD